MKGGEGGVREGYEGCVVLKELLRVGFGFEIDGLFLFFFFWFFFGFFLVLLCFVVFCCGGCENGRGIWRGEREGNENKKKKITNINENKAKNEKKDARQIRRRRRRRMQIGRRIILIFSFLSLF